MNFRNICFILAAATAAVQAVGASLPDSVPSFHTDKLTITPTARFLIDGAVYTPDGDGFNAGATIYDARAGFKASYADWSLRMEVGFGYGKFSVKDIYAQYRFNSRNAVRGGYVLHQFGICPGLGSSMKSCFENPVIDTFFGVEERNIGVMYLHDSPMFLGTASAFVAGTSLTTPANEQGKTSYGGMTRLVARPFHSTGNIAQVGLSASVQSALHKAETVDGVTGPSEGYFNFTSNFPTRVCRTPMLGAYVSDARNVVKLSPELIVARGRLAAEAQYFWMSVARSHDRHAYQASGVYALLRGMVIGDDYGYNHGIAALANPAPGSLEVVAGYSYTDATCPAAEVYGGRSNDVSLTLNYYINRYMLARLRYSYTDVSSSAVQRNRHVNIIQARFQVLF